MAAKTRQLPSALPGRRAGSFAGKTTTTVSASGHYEPLRFPLENLFTVEVQNTAFTIMVPATVSFDIDLRA